MPKPMIERRFTRCEFRVSEDGTPKISGYAAVFDSPSEDMGWFTEMREEIDPHFFDRVLQENPDVRGLFNHDPNFVLGRTLAKTMRLSVDARGLTYDIDPPDTSFARDLMISMKRGDITGSSFAFTTKRDQWTDNPDGTVTRRLLECGELYDVSPVTYPAYPSSTSEARASLLTMPKEIRDKHPNFFKMFSKRDALSCSCECDECQGGDCTSCTHDGCQPDAEGCLDCGMTLAADEEMNARTIAAEDERRRLAIRVGLAF